MRLVIVDDQKLFRQNLKTVIELRLPEANVVGIAGNGLEALQVIGETKPDLILLDMRMPIMDGVECLRRLRDSGDNTQIIVLTTFDDDQYVFEALRLEVAGYLLKDIDPEELTNAIEKLRMGGKLVSPQVTEKLVKEATRHRYGNGEFSKNLARLAQLTQREIEVLKRIALGDDNQEIAHVLCITEGTVKNYVSSIYEKLEFRDRAQAIRFAIMQGIV